MMSETDRWVLPLVDLRYFTEPVRWPEGRMDELLARFIEHGYIRVEPNRQNSWLHLTCEGHRIIDNSRSVFALPTGLHFLPDDRLLNQPVKLPGRCSKFHDTFEIAIPGPLLFDSLYKGAEIYIGNVPSQVSAGDHILLTRFGRPELHPVVVAVTRVFNSVHACHARVSLPKGAPRLSVGGDPRIQYVNPVGMWHKDVKPIEKHIEDALDARLGWTGRSWAINILLSGSNVASRVICCGKLKEEILQVCGVRSVSVVSESGRIFIEGPELAAAHSIFWVLRQAYRIEPNSRRVLDWMFDKTTAKHLGLPSRQEILKQRLERQ
ncbi:MAG TPA: hypothetical protein VFT87_05030 [Candidatus Saccharimonadales bacterium]|nr:hypothetical protein [Candidatus Saccharimonadales bacterium]